MKKLVLTLLIGITTLTAFSQNAFSFKRQLNYQQCKKCYCKKSRKYSIISTNLTSSQLVCAQEDNRSNLSVKEMFQNGTSGGLFGGSNPRQEGCGNDCYHEFINAKDEVETVKINECLTENQRQINRNEQQKAQEQEQRKINDKQLAYENAERRIKELRKNAYLDFQNNKNGEACKKFKDLVDSHILVDTKRNHDPKDYGGNYWSPEQVQDLHSFLILLYNDNQFKTMDAYCSKLLYCNFSVSNPINPAQLPLEHQIDIKVLEDLRLYSLISMILNKKELKKGWLSLYSSHEPMPYSVEPGTYVNRGLLLINCLKQKQTTENSAYLEPVIQYIDYSCEDRYPAYGVVLSKKYCNKTPSEDRRRVTEIIRKPNPRLTKSIKISEDFYYYNDGSYKFFYFILSTEKGANSYSGSCIKRKGCIIILNSFKTKNNEAPSDKKIAEALEQKLELEQIIEKDKGINLESKTYFFSEEDYRK